jgi:thimet oligopeptidase
MVRIVIGRLAAALALAVMAGPAASASTDLPAFPDTPASLAATCDRHLAQARADGLRLERAQPDAAWLPTWDDFQAGLEAATAPLFFMAHVHPEPAMRAAAEACEQRWQDFYSTLGQNPRLARTLRAVPAGDAIDQRLRQEQVDAFDDAGVGLPPARRAQAKRLQDRLAQLAQRFDRRLRDARIQVPFTEAELAGVPADLWQAAPRDRQGRRLLGVKEPEFVVLMQSAHDARARERMWRASFAEGGQANLRLLAEIVRTRHAYARLFGADSYAQFRLRRMMAASPGRVRALLDEVLAAVREAESRELAELRRAKAAHLGVPEAGLRFERWDLAYYQERRRRERHAVDQEAFRAHFPPEASLRFVMRIAERLFGVRYQRITDAAVWHPDVQAYTVQDADSGRALATLYVDLFPRDGKYGHAAVWTLRSGATRTGALPVAALVVNLDRRGLTLEDLETTLLHEFGHAVHNNLSATRHALQAGTSVKLDFVEAPSQMLEDWVYHREVLALMGEVCPSCPPVPAALLERAIQARQFGKGLRYARQHLYASYDLALFDGRPGDPMALWRRMESATPLGYVPGSLFPASFAHSAGGYGAGYYSYLWSEVLAADLRTAFATSRLDPAVGRRYRDTMLGQGGQRAPDALMRDFLGRDSRADAFFDELRR